jgi:hypothetical protein
MECISYLMGLTKSSNNKGFSHSLIQLTLVEETSETMVGMMQGD